MSNEQALVWHEMEDVPLDTPLFFLLEKPHLGSRIHSGKYSRGAGGSVIRVIGGLFTWDLGSKPIRWAFQPEIPEGL